MRNLGDGLSDRYGQSPVMTGQMGLDLCGYDGVPALLTCYNAELGYRFENL